MRIVIIGNGVAGMEAALAVRTSPNPRVGCVVVRDGSVVGAVAERLRALASELRLELPILDLSGLEAPRARRLLDALGPANSLVDAGIWTP